MAFAQKTRAEKSEFAAYDLQLERALEAGKETRPKTRYDIGGHLDDFLAGRESKEDAVGKLAKFAMKEFENDDIMAAKFFHAALQALDMALEKKLPPGSISLVFENGDFQVRAGADGIGKLQPLPETPVFAEIRLSLKQLAKLQKTQDLDLANPGENAGLPGLSLSRAAAEGAAGGFGGFFGIRGGAREMAEYYENFGRIIPSAKNGNAARLVAEYGAAIFTPDGMKSAADAALLEFWGMPGGRMAQELGEGKRLFAESYVKMILVRQAQAGASSQQERDALEKMKHEAVGGALAAIRKEILDTPQKRQAWNGFLHLANDAMFGGLRQNGIEGQMEILGDGRLSAVVGYSPTVELPQAGISATLNNVVGVFAEASKKASLLHGNGGDIGIEVVARAGGIFLPKGSWLSTNEYGAGGKSFAGMAELPSGAIPVADAFAVIRGNVSFGKGAELRYSVRADLPPAVLGEIVGLVVGPNAAREADRLEKKGGAWQDYALTISPSVEASARETVFGVPAIIRAHIGGNLLGQRVNSIGIGLTAMPSEFARAYVEAGMQSPAGSLAPHVKGGISYTAGGIRANFEASRLFLGGGNLTNISFGVSASGVFELFGKKQEEPPPQMPSQEPASRATVQPETELPIFRIEMKSGGQDIYGIRGTGQAVVFKDGFMDACYPASEMRIGAGGAAKSGEMSFETNIMEHNKADEALNGILDRVSAGEKIDAVVFEGYGKFGIWGETPLEGTIARLLEMQRSGFEVPKLHFIGASGKFADEAHLDIFGYLAEKTGGAVQIVPAKPFGMEEALEKAAKDAARGIVHFPSNKAGMTERERDAVAGLAGRIRLIQQEYLAQGVVGAKGGALGKEQIEAIAASIVLGEASVSGAKSRGMEFKKYLYERLKKEMPGFELHQNSRTSLIEEPPKSSFSPNATGNFGIVWGRREGACNDFCTKELFRAIDTGDYEKAIGEIGAGALLNERKGAESPLMAVVKSGKFSPEQKMNLAKSMIAHGAKASDGDYKWDAITYALAANSGELLSLFLEAARPDKKGMAAYMRKACMMKDGVSPENLERLLGAGAEVNSGAFLSSPLADAASAGGVKTAEFLIKRGADVNMVVERAVSGSRRELGAGGVGTLDLGQGGVETWGRHTALTIALDNGDAQMARLLMDSGADIWMGENAHAIRQAAGSAESGRRGIVREEIILPNFWASKETFSEFHSMLGKAAPGFDKKGVAEKIGIAAKTLCPTRPGSAFGYDKGRGANFSAPGAVLGEKRGDCDEYAMALANYAVEALGVPMKDIQVAVYEPKKGYGHAVLAFELEGKRYIADVTNGDAPFSEAQGEGAGALESQLWEHGKLFFGFEKENCMLKFSSPQDYLFKMVMQDLEFAEKSLNKKRKARRKKNG